MTTTRLPARRVLAHCNAGGRFGAGHLMRVLAVLEEAVSRGWTAVLVGDIADDARAAFSAVLPEVEVEQVPVEQASDALAAHVERWSPTVLHLDTYWLDDDRVPRGAHVVSNVQDAPFGMRRADLVIDPNPGAERRADPALGAARLLGSTAVLVRRQVRERARSAVADPSRPRRVLVVLGGTDAYGLTSSVVAHLIALPGPLSLTVVAPAAQRDALERLAQSSPHPVTLTGFLSDLPAVAIEHDLVVSAAGTSVWDFAHLGVPSAILAVTENQSAGYREATERGLALGLGTPPHSDLAHRVAELGALLDDGDRLLAQTRRALLAIDGLGAWRVVSAWEQLPVARPDAPLDGALRLRPATTGDAGLLLAWRNDPATRAASRSAGEVLETEHLAWLARVLDDPDRTLLVAFESGAPVATARWDRHADGSREVSITVAPSARGRGVARAVLAAAEEEITEPGPVLLTAAVHVDNGASLRLFANAGYLPHLPADHDGFAVFAKWRWGGSDTVESTH